MYLQNSRLLKNGISFVRRLSTTGSMYDKTKNNERPIQKGLVLGVYNGCEKTDITLSPVTESYGSEISYDFKSALIRQEGIGEGEARVFDNLTEEYRAVALVGMGPDPGDEKDDKNVYQRREYIRNAAGIGSKMLQKRGVDEIYVEHMDDGEAAAEGATLGVWIEQQFRSYEDQLVESKVFLYEKGSGGHKDKWDRGFEKAKGQNLARYLTAVPANVMTPSIFGQHCAEELCPCGVSVDVHDHKWIKSKGMDAFLAIAAGSCEPPVLVELRYSNGGAGGNIVMVGKGCTYDSGGICLTHCSTQMYQHADMAGAASIVGLLKAMCKLKVPGSVTALLPMYENMPSENAVKTGSVLKTLNERTIRILHTYHDGRVVLADVLSYAGCLNPNQVINVATLSKSMMLSMGTGASGTFYTNNKHYELLRKSGEEAGDRVWSFPFYDDINMAQAKAADYGNRNVIAKGGHTLFGASLLREFAPPPPVDFMHIDIYGTTIASKLFPALYLRTGLPTGRPVRALLEYLEKVGKGEDK